MKRIQHQYDNKIVLSDVSYSFAKNNVTIILGRSGSGKTTLLQIINGMVLPDQGTVTVFDEPINYNAISALRLKIGYVIQQVGLFPHMNVQANISLLGRVSKLSQDMITARVKQLMELVQLPLSYVLKYPHELSGGEQQRVGLCRAMFLNPPILLMDEPFASLDYETKQGIYTHLLNIQKSEPRTVIIVTHDWDEALKLADHFIWLTDGKIKSSGDQAELRKAKTSYLKEA